jgi:Bacterial Ig-like domain/Domain of unknown function DUF11
MVALLAALLATTSTLVLAPNIASATFVTRNFAQRYQTIDNGDIMFVSNTLLTCPPAGGGCGNLAAITGTTTGAANNNATAMVNVDADGTPAVPAFEGGTITTWNSSSSTLAMPNGSEVLFAGLYFQGLTTGLPATGTNVANIADHYKVRFKTPITAYKALASNVNGTANTVAGTSPNYGGFVDVTADVQAVQAANGTANGDYWAANMSTGLGTQAYGGWTMVVAYKNATEARRQLTVFDGWASAAAFVGVPLSGFRTPPSGVVKTKIGVVAGEGDNGSLGDYVKLDNAARAGGVLQVSPATTATRIVSSINGPPTGATDANSDFFNSSIARYNGTSTSLVTTKNPNYVNQYGYDADIEKADGILPNGTLAADTFGAYFGTGGDVYYPTVITTAIEVYVPDFSSSINKSVVDVNGGNLELGDTLEYTISVNNNGLDNAIQSVLTDPIPSNTAYLPGSMVINGVSKTDAAGDDVANTCPATATASPTCPRVTTGSYVALRIGTAASATVGGTLAPNTATVTKFRVTVTSVAPGVQISNTARLNYVQETLGTAGQADSTAGIIGTATIPSTPDMVAASDTGASSTDNVTMTTTPIFTGTADVGSTVYIYDGTTLLGTTTATASGTYSFQPTTPLASGAHSINATAGFSGGGASVASGTLSLTIDTTAPLANQPDLIAASDTGTSNSDDLTKNTTLNLSGAAEVGSSVAISVDGGTATAATVDAAGNWTFTSGVLTGSLAGTTHTFTSTVTDLAGNVSTTSSTLTVTVDTSSATTFPAVTSPTATQTPTLSGVADPLSVVTIFDAGVSIGTTTANAAGAWTFTPSTNLATGSRSFSVSAVDPAGNLGTVVAQTINITAPTVVPPSLPDMTALTDSGSSSTDNITNVLKPTFTGVAPVGATVTLYDGATALAPTAIADASGNWSITLTANLTVAAHTITAKATVAAVTSAASAPLSITVDNVATVVITAPTPASTVSGTPTFTGTSSTNDAAATVQIKEGATVLCTTTTDSAGLWSCKLPTSATTGAHSYTATIVDVAGNTLTSTALALTIDATAPVAPITLDLATASDTGPSSTDNITSASLPTIGGAAGSAENNSTVKLYDNGTLIATVTASATGVWSYTPLVAWTQGVHNLTATANDAVGNVSPLSATLTVTIDTSTPLAPSVPNLADASDSGTSSIDDLTKTTLPTLTGTGEAGTVVTLVDGATVVGTATVAADGSWSVTIATALTDGTHLLKARVTDTAGNVSAYSTPLAVTVDTVVPATPVVPTLAASSDTGVSNSDRITGDTTPTLTGTAEANAIVTVYDGATAVGTTTANSLGNWTLDVNTLTDGAHSLTVKATDAAGNVSLASATLSVTIDGTAPVAPSVPDLTTATDTGTSTTDNLTKNITPAFTGTTEAGAVVKIYDGATLLGTAVVTGTTWTFTSPALAVGVHPISATATDSSGNVSVASDPLVVTIDTATSAAITSPVSGGSTSNSRPTYSGTAEVGATVTLFEGATNLGTAVADASGNWQITPATALTVASHTVFVTATDLAGNTANSANNTVVVTAAVVAVPSVPDLTAATDTGASSTDNVTNLATPALTGTAVAGSTVKIYDGATLIGTVTADGAGAWTLSPTLTEGVHTITVTATVGANTSAASSALSVTVDLTSPATPPTVDLAAGNDSGASNTDNITSDATPLLSGTAEANSTVTLYDGATVLAVVTANAAGTWSYQVVTALVAGPHPITVTSTDLAGNVSAASTSLDAVIDTAAPSTPGAPDLTATSDHGTSSTDNLTNLTTPTFSGSAEAGSTVNLYDGATLVGTAVASAGGTWTITSSTLAAGAHTMKVQAIDVAGNISALSAALSVNIDTTAPNAAPAPDLAAASDLGSSNTDNLTSATSLVLNGTSEANATVLIYDGATLLGSTTANASGVWTYTTPMLADGVHSLSANVMDAAGNVSYPSPALNVTVDAVAPVIGAPDMTPASDTGTSSTDDITADTTPTFTGTSSPSATIKVYDGATLLGNVSATGTGTWSFDSPTLTAGSHVITATATDAAGNVSATSAPLTVTIDPTAAVTLAAPAAGSSTGNANPTFSGTADVGATVQIKDGTLVLGTAVANALGNWTFTPVSPLGVGSHNFSAFATDIAGNTATSATNAVTITSTAVATPGLPDLVAASDTGVSNTDDVTSLTVLNLTGTAVANSTVKLYDGATLIATVTANGSGVWTYTTGTLTAGVHNFTVTATVGSNVSSASSNLAVTIITTAPAAPSAPDMTALTDTGVSTTDNITKTTTPTFTGTATANTIVKLYDGATLIGTTTSDATGNWSVTSTTLTDGAHTITAKTEDAAGNQSLASSALPVVIDTVAPVAAPAPDLNAASDTGTSSTDNLTKTTTPTLDGTAEANSTVKIYDGASLIATVTANAGGVWTYTPASALTTGVHVFKATVTDIAGNTSVDSATLSVTIDTAAPAVAITSPTDGTSTTNTTPAIIGTAEANALITVKDGATTICTTTAVGGTWSCTPATALLGGAHTITAVATDAAGNAATSVAVSLSIISATVAAPSLPDLIAASDSGASSTDDITNVTTPTLTGTSAVNATITVYDGATSLGTTTADGGGLWSFTVATALTNGVHVFTATAKVGAITSVLSDPLSVTIDTATTVTLVAPANGTFSATNLPTFSGTGEIGASVAVLVDGVVIGTVVVDGFGNWTYTATVAISDGAHAIAARITDVAGNTLTATAVTLTVDTALPAAPSTPDLIAASDTGTSTIDNITFDSTPTLTGTAEANSTVKIYDGATFLGSTLANGAGAWTFTPVVALIDGVHSLTATATDAAGNTSPASGALAITVDTVSPVAPPTADLVVASDTGASSTDDNTADTTPTLAGTAEPLSTVGVYDGVTFLGSVTADAAGNWTFTTGVLTDGLHNIFVRATDVAGNVSTVLDALNLTIDTTSPVAPPIPDLIAASDTGASSTDNVTSLTTPTLSGTAEANSSVSIYDGATLVGTVTADAVGAWTFTNAALTDGIHNFTIKATDVAGNLSAVSPTLAVTIDTVTPATPPMVDLITASDSGSSSTDNITNITTPTLAGTAETNSTVSVYDGATFLGSVTANGAGAWTFTTGVLTAGVHNFTVKSTDAAGNASAASTALAVTIDVTSPVAPATPDLIASSDTGTSSIDNITADNTPTLTGTAEANSVVSVYDGATLLGTTTADGSGAWIYTTATIADGVHNFTVKATDIAGNTSAASSPLLVVTVDTIAPATPAAPDLTAASDTGVSSVDDITAINTAALVGVVEANATVSIYDGATLLGTATANAAGAWTFTTAVLADGVHSLTVKATDSSGNLSAASPALSVTIDTVAPATPPQVDLTTASDTGVSNTDNVTNISTLSLAGTAEANSTVKFYDGATLLGTTTANGAGAWSFTTTGLLDGVHNLTIKAIDTAGNISNASNPLLAVTVDTLAPAAPSALDMIAASDTGVSSIDNLTKINTPTITGTAEANSTVAVYDGATFLGSVTADGAGAWTFTTGVLTDGVHSLTAKATDAAGNLSTVSPTLAITIDTTVPATPPAVDLLAGSDSGVSSTDNITKINTASLAGTAEPGSTVAVYDGATFLGSVSVDGAGNWTFTTGVLTDGVHNLTAKATDNAGNISASSIALPVTIDTTVPVTPVAADLVAASDTGVSSIDNITSITTPTLVGTAEANATVTVYDGGVLLGTTTANGAGVWSLVTGTLSDGVHNITVKATDTAGNISGVSATLAVTIDATAPVAPPIVDLIAASDTGASNTDNITNLNTLSLAGTAEVNSTVSVYDGATLLGTTTANGAGAWTFVTGVLVDGIHNLTVKATDTAGNTSTASPLLAVTVDTSAPVAPPIVDLVTASDTGASNTDNITGVNVLSLAGTAEANATVKIYDGVTLLGTVTADALGVWTFTTTALSEGAHSLTVKATDPAGNTSAASPVLAVTIDTVTPAVPSSPDLLTASDSGVSSIDNITAVNTPTLTGTAEANSTVKIYDGATLVGTVTANGVGAWSFTSTALTEGAHSFTSTATDTAGNTSAASAALPVVIDTIAPLTPPIVDLVAASDTGVSNTDNVTSLTTLSLAGTAEANATVAIYDGATLLGTVTATGAGVWTFATGGLTEGVHNLTAKATDSAGNTSAASPLLAVTIDTVAPTAPPVAALNTASNSGSLLDTITNINTPTISGTAEANSTVKVYDGAVLLGTAVADGAGVWSFTSPVLTDGIHNLTTTATDAAGNTSSVSAALSITVDTVTPVAPAPVDLVAASDTGASSIDNITTDNTPTLSGTAEANSTIKIYDGLTLVGTVTADGAGAWTFTTAVIVDGTHSLSATSTDTAGNTSAASSPLLVIVVDTVAPVAPSTPDLVAGSDSGASSTDNVTAITTPTFSGTAEPNSTVSVYDGAVFLGSVTANGSGVWTFTTGVLLDGVHNLSAKSTDTAGNVSVASGSLAVTVDTAAPTAPPAATLNAASNSGSLADTVTNVNTPTISGTAEANSTVKVYDGATLIGTVTANGAGVWTFTSGVLTDGVHSLTTTSTDAAGNTSAASAVLSVTVDTVSPVATSPVDLTAASDSGLSNTDNITQINTPVVTGTAEANSTVKIYDGATLLGSVTANGSGVWTFTTGVLLDGSHSLSSTATDTAGNVSVSSTPLLVVIVDTVAPVAPGLPDLTAASDTGLSSTDNVTGINTPVLTGTAEANSTVKIYDGATLIGTVTANGAGVWTFTTPVLSDGVHSVTTTSTDTAGNTSVASPVLSVTVDTVSPVATSPVDLTAGSDSGLSSTDNITNVTTPALTGTAEPLSTVKIYDGATLLGSVTANGAGVWTFTTGVLADGSHNLSSTATDTAGNVSVSSTPLLVVIVDTVAPVAPGPPDLTAASDTGLSSTDNVTGVNTPVLTGTAEANSTVKVYDGATLIGTVTANASGVWTFTTPVLTDGVHSITTTSTDTAGNTSVASAALSITVDTVSPVATSPVDLTAASDSGLSSTDNITQINAPVVTGTAEVNSTVKIYDGATLLGSVTANGAGVWTFTTGVLVDGSHSLSSTATDTAGNVSVSSTPLLVVIVDTVAPVAPPAATLNAASNSGSLVDTVTNVNTPTISGTAEVNSTVKVYDGATLIGTVTANASGVWTFTTPALTDGVHSITTTSTDTAGNTSVASAALSVTVDTISPVATSPVDLTAGSDSGLSSADNITQINTPVVTGTAEANSTVKIYDGATLLGSVTANGSGVWTFTTGVLLDGSHNLSSTATDTAGNTSVSSTPLLVVIVDTAAPVAPSLPDLTAASDTGLSSTDNVTGINTPVLTGTAEANSTVKVYDGATLIATVTANGAGVWTFTTAALTDGVHSITTTSTDTAGNTSAASAVLSVTVDTVSPVATSPVDLTAASDSGLSSTDNITQINTPVVTGTAEANSTVKIYDGATLLGSVTANGSGVWTFTTGVLLDGSHNLSSTATDTAGNTSVSSTPLLVVIVDTVAPAAPSLPDLTAATDTGLSSTDNVTGISTPVLTGTAEANSTVKIYDGATLIATVTANGAGVWTFTSPVLSDGVHGITTTSTDTAGNTSAASSALSVTVDTVSPVATSPVDLTAGSDSGLSSTDNITNVSTPVLTGTAEANSTVKIYDGATLIGTVTANGAGVWTFTTPVLTDGVHSITTTSTDTAGNTSVASPALSATVDTVSPVATSPVDLTAASDSGVSSTDNITQINTPVLTGTAEANSTVKIYDGATFLGSVTATGAGVWTFTTGVLLDGSHNLSSTATDTAGNVSVSSTPVLVIIVDTVAPVAPGLPDLTAATDTGLSSTDNVTGINTPALTGAAEANSTVKIYDGATLIGTVTANGAGVWTFTSPVLTDGVHGITTTSTDTAGNTSVASPALSITIDTLTPVAPSSPDLTAVSDTGTSSTDNITADNTPTLTGTGEPGSTVKIYNGATLVGTATVDGTGHWTVTTSVLADGVASLTATVTDPSGNVSPASAALSVTIDTTAPAAPPAVDLTAASDTGASSTDNITADNTPTLAGTAEPFSIVKVYDGATFLGSVTADAAGNWTFTTAVLIDAVHTFSVTATDSSGNTSAASTPLLVITVDTIAPVKPPAATLDNASNSGSLTDTITSDNTPTISGSAEPGSLVKVYDGATLLGTVTAAANGTWSFTTPVLTDGAHSLTVTATDTSGNTSLASAPLPITVDTIAPAAPSAADLIAADDWGPSNTDNLTNVTTPTLTGTGEPGATITVYDGVNPIGTTTVLANGTWSFTTPVLGDGSHDFTTTATDTANNTGAVSAPLTIVVATSADLELFTTGDEIVTAGVPTSFTLTVVNNGVGDAADATVAASLPAGFTFAGFTSSDSLWSCTVDVEAQTVTCVHAGYVGAGSTTAVTILTDVASDALGEATLVTVLTSTTPDQKDNNTNKYTLTISTVADLAVTMTHSAPVVAGTNVTYTVAVANHGPSDAAGQLVATLPLPAGMTFVSSLSTSDLWTCTADATTVSCVRDISLPTADSDVINITLAVSQAGPLGATTPSDPTATVVSTTYDPSVEDNTSTDPTTVIAVSDLAVQVNSAGPWISGAPVSYQLSLTNAGPSDTPSRDVDPVVTVFTLPAGVTYTGFDGPGWFCESLDGTTVKCQYTKVVLADNEPVSVTINTSTLASIPEGTVLTATASITAQPTVDPHPADNTDITLDTKFKTEADLVLTTGHLNNVAGAPVSYQVSLFNAGPSDSSASVATPITTVVTLPTGVTFTGFDGVGWDCSSVDGTIVTCDYTLRIIPLDDPVSVTLLTETAASIPFGTTLSATASITHAPNTDVFPTNDTDITEPVTFTTVADLIVDVNHLDNPVAGTTIGVQLALINDGPSDVPATAETPVTVVLTLPAGLTYAGFVDPGWSCASADGQTVTCEFLQTVYAHNEPVSVTVLVAVAPDLVGVTVTPTATITVTPTFDPVAANHTDIADPMTFVGQADLVLTVGHTPAVAGSDVTYQLSVFNAGPSKVTASEGNPVVSTLTLPEGVTFTGFDGIGWSCASADGQLVTCEYWGSILAYDDPIAVNVTAHAASSIVAGTTLTAMASIMVSPLTDPAGANNLGIAEPTLFDAIGDVDLRVQQLVVSATAGTQIEFQLSLVDHGPSDVPGSLAHPTRVVANLPAGLTFVSAFGPDWSCSSTDGVTVTCDYAATLLAGNEPMQVIVIADSATTIPNGTIDVTASVTMSTVVDPNPANDQLIVGGITFSSEADLQLTATHVGTVTAGTSVTYQLAVFNAGPSTSAASAERPIVVQATLPTGETFAGFDGAGWTCTSDDGVLVSCAYTASIGALDDPSLVQVTAQSSPAIVAGTTADMRASIVAQPTADSMPGNSTNIADPTSFTAIADLDIRLQQLVPSAVAGTQVEFQLAIVNHGPSDAPGSIAQPTQVTATLPTGLTYASSYGPDWSCASTDGVHVVCDYQYTLWAGNEPMQVMIDAYSAASIPAGVLTVTASVTAATVIDPDPSNDQGVAGDLTFTTEADIVLGIAHIDAATPGATVMYQLAIYNAGPSDVVPTAETPIVVEVTLPSTMTFTDFDGPGWTCASVDGHLVTCTSTERLGAMFDPSIVNIYALVSTTATLGAAADVTGSVTATPTLDQYMINQTGIVDPAVVSN